MQTITKKFETETGHRLMDYSGKCAHLHGHRYEWLVEIRSDHGLDKRGMVIDFSDLKKIAGGVINEFDHAMVLRTDDPLVRQCEGNLLLVKQMLRATDGSQPRLLIHDWNPTAENLAKHVLLEINRNLGSGFICEHIRLWETSNSFVDAYRD